MAITLEHVAIGTPAGTEAASTTQTLTTNQTIAAGSTILLAVGWASGASGANAGIASVADNGPGLTWVLDIEESGQSGLGTSCDVGIVRAHAPSGMASGTVITVTFDTSSFVRCIAGSSFAGVPTGGPTDTAGDLFVDPAATGWTTGNLTLGNGSLAFAVNNLESGDFNNTMSAGAEASEWGVPSAPQSIVSAYRIEATGGTYTLAGAWSSAAKSTTVGAVYAAGGSDATVTAVTSAGTGDNLAPTLAAGSTVTSPAADGTGTIPAPTVTSATNATVTAVPCSGTGDIPDLPMSSEVTSPTLAGTGAFVAPAVSAGGSATVAALAGTGTGDLVAPTNAAGAAIAAIAASASGDLLVQQVSDGTAPPVGPAHVRMLLGVG